jgi:hypothetical protein
MQQTSIDIVDFEGSPMLISKIMDSQNRTHLCASLLPLLPSPNPTQMPTFNKTDHQRRLRQNSHIQKEVDKLRVAPKVLSYLKQEAVKEKKKVEFPALRLKEEEEYEYQEEEGVEIIPELDG